MRLTVRPALDSGELAANLAGIPTQFRVGGALIGAIIVVLLLAGRRRRSGPRVLAVVVTILVAATLSLGPLLAEHGLLGGSAGQSADPAAVGPDTPGPDGGPACAADTRHTDETTDGLADDVAAAWHEVVAAAAADGVVACLNDGKRSRAQQQAQYDEYVSEYGRQAAGALVLPPDKSAHVTGTAIDVQPAAAYRWLQSSGGAWGWCRIYENEPWHFEYRGDYAQLGCPPLLPAPQR